MTNENCKDFAAKMRDWRLRTSLALPLQAMAKGLRAAVPSRVIVDARKMLSADAFGRVHGPRAARADAST